MWRFVGLIPHILASASSPYGYGWYFDGVIIQKAVRWATVGNVFWSVPFSMHFRDFFCKFQKKKRKRIVDAIEDYITLRVPCCDVCYDFRINTIFCSSLPPIVCCLRSRVQHILCCFSSYCVLCTLCCQFLWIVHIWLTLGCSLMFIHHLYQTIHTYSVVVRSWRPDCPVLTFFCTHCDLLDIDDLILVLNMNKISTSGR